MEPAPYGGFMTRTLDEENEKKQLLDRQKVTFSFNGEEEMLRPNTVHVRGVDNLSTEQIQSFVDLYLNYDTVSSPYQKKEESVWFRIQWIDDSNANVIFHTHEDSLKALERLSLSWPDVQNSPDAGADSPVFSENYLNALIEERQAQPYAPSIEFNKYQSHLKELALAEEEKDLFEEKRKEKQAVAENEMDEDGSSVVLYIRQAFESDRKVKNAAAYSRYYLLHGEPDRSKPRRPRKTGEDRGNFTRNDTEEEDLFAGKLKTEGGRRGREEDEEDLFASRLRDRSPSRR